MAEVGQTGQGRRWVPRAHPTSSWMLGISSFAISVATALSRSVEALRAWRVVMGIGTGGMEPVDVALVSEWWQKEDRGFAVTVHHTGFPVGQLVGPLLIGAVLAVGTWRDAFLWLPLIAIPIACMRETVKTNTAPAAT